MLRLQVAIIGFHVNQLKFSVGTYYGTHIARYIEWENGIIN